MSIGIESIILAQIKINFGNDKKVIGGLLLEQWGAATNEAISKVDGSHLGGLKLIVDGRFHKGCVAITLNESDTYDIDFIDQNQNLLHKIKAVSAEDLTRVIDSYVESNSLNDH